MDSPIYSNVIVYPMALLNAFIGWDTQILHLGVVTILYPYYNDILFTVSCYNFSKNACIVVLYLYLCILVWYLKKSICTQRSLILIGDAPWNVELIFIEEIAVKVR